MTLFSNNWMKIVPVLLIVVICGIVYIPSLGNGFVWDDDLYVYENELLQKNDGLKDIWLTRETPQYYPMVFTLFWLEHKAWGLNPFPFHVVGLLIHILNALLLFLLVKKLFPRAALLAALIFAVHPIQVETVAWITEAKNLMAVMFFLMATLSYIKYEASDKKIHYVVSLLLFIGALLSKSVSVCFVAVPMLYAWWKNGKIMKREIAATVPLVVFGAIAAFNTVFLEIHSVGAKGEAFNMSIIDRIVMSGRTVLFYIYKVCIPGDFIFFYPRWQIDITQIWQWVFVPVVVGIAVVLYMGRKVWGRGAFALFLFYLISIFPASGILNVYPMIYSFVADHFSYMSIASIILILCGALVFVYDAVRSKVTSNAIAGKVLKITAVSLVSVYVVFLSAKTMAITGNYKDEISLWTSVINKNPGSDAAHTNLGRQYELMGEPEKALEPYTKATEMAPGDFTTYYNLGNVYMALRQFQEAVPLYEKALQIDQRFPDVYNNLGIAYGNVGEFSRAFDMYVAALKVRPDYSNAVTNLVDLVGVYADYFREGENSKEMSLSLNSIAIGQAVSGKNGAAEKLFIGAIAMDENNAEAFNNLGFLYYNVGYPDKAREFFKKALEIDPENAKAESNLKVVENTLEGEKQSKVMALNQKAVKEGAGKNFEKAHEYFNEALEIDPGYAETYNNLAYLYYMEGDMENAEKYFLKTLEIDPNHQKAKNNLQFFSTQKQE